MYPEFNAVLIIDSIESESTSKDLKLDIEHASVNNPIGVVLLRVATPADFIAALEGIAEDFSIIPIVHIVAHGNEDGIKLIDGFVQWHQVLLSLQKINIRLKNRLAVVLALCLGAHMIRHIDHYDRAPFNILLSPHSSIDHGILERLMTVFYQGLLKNNSFSEGVKAMFSENGDIRLPFITVSCMQLIQGLRLFTVNRIKSGKARHNLFREYRNKNKEKMSSELKNKIQETEDQVDLYESVWREYASKFLMLDLLGTEPPDEVTPYLSFKDYYYKQ